MKDNPKRVPTPPAATVTDRVGSAVSSGLAAALGAVCSDPEAAAALAGTIGYLGPLFPSPFAKRMDSWRSQLLRGVRDLERRKLDVDALRESEEFADLMIASTEVALRTRHEAKRERLRHILVNSVTSDASESRMHLFVRLVDDLDEHHIDVLRFAVSPHAYLKEAGRALATANSGGRTIYDSVGPAIELAFKDFNDDTLIELAFEELARRKLVVPLNTAVECRPQTTLLTDLGRAFCDHVTLDKSDG